MGVSVRFRRMPAFVLALALVVSPAYSDGVVTREITFGPGNALYGQLDRPDGNGPFPVVILLPAGGGLDRDGTSVGLAAFRNLYLPLVEVAVRSGWAIFRYDRRGTGRSRSLERNEAYDALEAVRVALGQASVDRERVVVVAHASGTEFLRHAYTHFEEQVGFRALKGVILLSSKVGSQTAGHMAGDLLVVVGEGDTDGQKLRTDDAVAVHRRTWPEARAEAVIVPGADYPLCDTTAANWRGWRGEPGSCAIPQEVYRAVERFLQRLNR